VLLALRRPLRPVSCMPSIISREVLLVLVYDKAQRKDI